MPYRKRKPGKAPLPAVDDVLSGRVRVDAGTLIDLIVRVNPTGLPLTAREAAARYARKSALQSLLIRLCADDLEAEAEPGQEGIVSLRHRRLGRFACHVALADLDDDARSWVRMQIDSRDAQAQEDARAGVRERAKKKADEGDGKQGLDALDAYDYDRARSCLETAFEKSGGDAAPAEALLSLLVETLGACEEALAAASAASSICAWSGTRRIRTAPDASTRLPDFSRACVTRQGSPPAAATWCRPTRSPAGSLSG